MKRPWWDRPTPAPAVCYRTKADALRAFVTHNRDVIDNYGGVDARHRPAEFDALNHARDLTGRRRVQTIADALWHAYRGGPPWCVEDIDLDLLNATTPGQNHPVGFTLPGIVVDELAERQRVREEEDHAIDEGLIDECFTRFRGVKRGRFRAKKGRKRVPGAVRERACVCRDGVGRFRACPIHGMHIDDVPF